MPGPQLALDRYIYLASNAIALSRRGHDAKPELTAAFETLKRLYDAGDGQARRYLWTLLREEPDRVAYGRTGLSQLFAQEIRPRVRVERG